MIPPHTNRYPKPPSGAATGWGRFFCWGESAAAGGCGGVKTPPYGAKDTWAVMARWRAGHARPLRTAVKIYAREGQGRAAALPLCSGRVVAREWMATQGPSESPSHLTVTGAVAHVTAPLLFVESKNKKHVFVEIKACATDFLENQKFSMDL